MSSASFAVAQHRAEIAAKGVSIARGFFAKEQVDEALKGVEEQVDRMACALYRAGKIKTKHQNHPVHTRLIALERDFPNCGTLIHKNPTLCDGIKQLWGGDETVRRVKDLLQVDHVAAHANWNLRCKTPDHISQGHGTVPFHQDTAYLEPSGDNTFILTAWVPLVKINLSKGPMEFAPGRFWEKKALLPHTGCHANTWYLAVEEEEIEKSGIAEGRVVFEDMAPGDVLLFDSYVPHRSLPNNSAVTRWSVDLRWASAADPTGSNAPVIPMEGRYEDIDWACTPCGIPAPWEKVGLGEGSNDREARKLNQAMLSPLIGGPWMDRWPMTNANEHVDAYRSGTLSEIARNPPKESDARTGYW